MMSEEMTKQGILIQQAEVTALTAWAQYYKNIMIPLIVAVVMFCGLLTSEYHKGTLINILTKGLSRWKVIAAKAISAVSIWTICYWLCFGITYAYCIYFWDNTLTHYVGFASFCIWLFGILLIAIILWLSSFSTSSSLVLLGVSVALVGFYLLQMVPFLTDAVPVKLLSSGSLIDGSTDISHFLPAVYVTILLSMVLLILAAVQFNRKKF